MKAVKPKEACGIFGINSEKSCFERLGRGSFHIQNRGQRYGGFSVVIDGKLKTENEPGLIKPTFEDKKRKDPELLKAKKGIAHVSLLDPQPIWAKSPNFGPFALTLNGRIINIEEVLKWLGYPSLFVDSHAEILANVIAKGKDCVSGIENVFQVAKGAYCLGIITPENVYTARDPFGFKPLILARSLDGCAFSSETPGLEKIGMRIIRDVKPGEIVEIEETEFKILTKVQGVRRAICPFEYSYFARESGFIEGVYVKDARHNDGKALAENDNIGAHLVSPIPFSGNAHAEGYALASNLPLVIVFEYFRYSDRSWTPESQETSDEIAEEKLSITRSVLGNKVIVIVDDSIFGATQIGGWVLRLLDLGAREVHVRIAVPPVRYPCIFDFPNRTGKRLIYSDHTEEEVKKITGAKTLKHNTLEAFLSSIISAQSEEAIAKNPLKQEDFCTYCFTGINPFD